MPEREAGRSPTLILRRLHVRHPVRVFLCGRLIAELGFPSSEATQLRCSLGFYAGLMMKGGRSGSPIGGAELPMSLAARRLCKTKTSSWRLKVGIVRETRNDAIGRRKVSKNKFRQSGPVFSPNNVRWGAIGSPKVRESVATGDYTLLSVFLRELRLLRMARVSKMDL